MNFKQTKPASLVLRVCLTLIAAFVAVFVVLFAYIGYTTIGDGSGDVDRSFTESARYLAEALGDVETADQARTAVHVLNAHNRRADLELSGPGALVTVVAGPDGLPLEPAPTLPAIDYAKLPEGVYSGRAGGRAYRTYTHRTARWTVAIVDPAPAARERHVLREMGRELAGYVGAALLIVLLPVWLAVRAGLAPLRRLSKQVAARESSDLTPVTTPTAYRELQPLVGAINGLLERLSHSLAREKAFVNDAAHEMRTPLAVISAQAHVLAGADDAQARAESKTRLERAVERASHLAHQLLRLAQMDARDLSMRRDVDAMQIIRDSLAGLAPSAAQRETEIALNGPDAALIHTDPHALQSIIDNLLDNALRYGGRGGSIEVSVEHGPAALELRVTDQGPGIPAEERAAIFERFRRGHGADVPGAGLGLAIVRQAAHSLGGEVELTTGPNGRGCEFRVRLPV